MGIKMFQQLHPILASIYPCTFEIVLTGQSCDQLCYSNIKWDAGLILLIQSCGIWSGVETHLNSNSNKIQNIETINYANYCVPHKQFCIYYLFKFIDEHNMLNTKNYNIHTKPSKGLG